MYLTQGLHRCVQTTPDAIATICGDRRTSFATLYTRVARLAGAMRAMGLAADDRVAYLGYNSDRFHEFYLASFWADIVVNPINTRWSAKEIAYSLADSGSRILFVDEVAGDKVEAILADYSGLIQLVWVGEAAVPAGMVGYEDLQAASPVEDVRRGGDSLAGLFYTGGTTGFPKGVMLTHPTPQRSPSYAYAPAVGLANAMCSAGPISRDVLDAANLLQIIAGPDPRALFNWPGSPPDYVGQLNDGVSGLRMAWSEDLGIPSNHDDADTPATLAALNDAVREFANLGAIVESVTIDLAEAGEVYGALLSARSGPGGEDSGNDGVSALLALNADFVDALHARARLCSRVEALFAQYDVLLCPTMRSVASPWANWTESLPWTYTLPWNLIGFPAISIPAGLVRGMPVGLQLIGRPDSEPMLFRAAEAFLSLHPSGPFPSEGTEKLRSRNYSATTGEMK